MLSLRCRIVYKSSPKLGIISELHRRFNNGEVNNNKISIKDFYRGKSVFLTGGSGFLGKVFIQKLLDIDGVGNIYFLIRDKKGVKIENRVQEIFNNELFRNIRETRPEDLKKIVPVAGDVALPNLGISDEDENILRQKVSVVIHSAATVRFYEQLSVSMNINYEGTKRIVELCKRMDNLEVSSINSSEPSAKTQDAICIALPAADIACNEAFVHISTAYANTDRKVVDEVVYPSPRSIQEVYDFIQKGFTDQELKEFMKGKPNTYTFSKAITEKYIEDNHGDIPTAIVRPSIVTSTAHPPVVGWVDNWAGVARIGYDVAQGYARVVPGDGTNIMDMIPVDYCANLTLAASAKCPRTKKLTVYHSCSSSVNPTTAREIYEGLRLETIKSRQNALPFPTYIYAKSDIFIRILSFFLQTVPAYVADYYLKITGGTPKWVKLNDRVVTYREAIKPFSMAEWIFISRNMKDLHEELSPEDQHLFPVSPHDVDWKMYIPTYSQGIRKYLTY